MSKIVRLIPKAINETGKRITFLVIPLNKKPVVKVIKIKDRSG